MLTDSHLAPCEHSRTAPQTGSPFTSRAVSHPQTPGTLAVVLGWSLCFGLRLGDSWNLVPWAVCLSTWCLPVMVLETALGSKDALCVCVSLDSSFVTLLGPRTAWEILVTVTLLTPPSCHLRTLRASML